MTARKPNPKKGNFVPQDDFDLGGAPSAPVAKPATVKPFEPVESIMQRYCDRLNECRTRYAAEIAKAKAVRDLEKEWGYLVALKIINQALVW